MCFFKPKMPTINPQVAPAIPMIQETTAPEPQAPIFGGGSQALAESGETSSKGMRGLKIPLTEKAAGIGTATGASKSGFNGIR